MIEHFNCPHCGAPGKVVYGSATYTCSCRLRTFVPLQPEPKYTLPERCPMCGKQGDHTCVTCAQGEQP